MVHLRLAKLIKDCKGRLLNERSLGVLFYRFVNKEKTIGSHLSEKDFQGETEYLSYKGYMEQFVEKKLLERALLLINNQRYTRYLNIFHVVGLGIQFQLQDDPRLNNFLDVYFQNRSIEYKYLMSRALKKYRNGFKKSIELAHGHQKIEVNLLRMFTLSDLKDSPDISELEYYDEKDLSISSLIIFEDYLRKRHLIYQKEKEILFDLVLRASVEIQSKHLVFKNNEDQFNSMYHSLYQFRETLLLKTNPKGENLNLKKNLGN